MLRIIFFILLALFLLIELYRDLLKRAVSPFEFMHWVIGMLATAYLLLSPGASTQISQYLGFELPSNLIFSTLIGVLYVSLRQTKRSLANTHRQLTEIAQQIAIMNFMNASLKEIDEENKP